MEKWIYILNNKSKPLSIHCGNGFLMLQYSGNVHIGGIVMARKCSAERAEIKAGGFATAKKNVTIQYQGRERSEDNLLALIRKDVLQKGISDDEIELVDVYIKPEEQMVFYVINKNIEGSIAF